MAGNRKLTAPDDPTTVGLERLEQEAADRAVLERLVHELKVHQEELRSQQDDLIETQHALEASRDRYVDLFDFSPVGYVTLDASGVIREINLTAARLVGIDRGRLLGWPFIVNVAEDERRKFLQHMRGCRGSDAAVKTELTLKARNRGLVPVELISRRFGPSTPDHDVCFHTSLIDLTDRRQAEEGRRRAEEERTGKEKIRAASEAKDRFLAMLSHELRTPLTPILFAIATLEAGGKVPEALRPTFRMIRRNIDLEARLIDDLLDVTRIARDKLRLEPETFDLHEAVRDVVDMLDGEFRARQVEVAVTLDAAEHHVYADPIRLRQVVANLVRNAVQHTPAGGRVTLASVNDAPGMVRVSITDTGAGIEPAALGRIFELFEQADDEHHRGPGLGIGLAVCKGIVEAHAGRISATSEGRGRGARFEIEFATIVPPTEAAASSEAVSTTANGARILLVEDNADNAQAMSYFLRARGYEVTVATNVEEALRHGSEELDLVISDIGLPDGNGYDLLRRLSQARPVRAIALSGYGAEDDIQRSTAAGFDRHLTKPVDPEQLIDAIESLPAPRRAAS